jgi:hypothetical protein
MLRRTMSQDNDASKDAETTAETQESQKEAVSSETSEGDATTAETSSKDVRDPSTRSKDAGKDAEGELDEPPIPETEEALNIPKPQTVGMLGAMSTLTLICWFAARLACNAHPDQVREPKHFSTKDLAADPKNAAFEFHHSFQTGDFETALDLASGEVRKMVEAKLVECESKPDECEDNRAKLAGSIKSTAKVLEEVGGRSTVELVSFYSKQLEPKTFQFTVEKQGDFYRVTTQKQVPNAANVPTLAVGSASSPVPASPSSTVGSAPPAAPLMESASELSSPVTDAPPNSKAPSNSKAP